MTVGSTTGSPSPVMNMMRPQVPSESGRRCFELECGTFYCALVPLMWFGFPHLLYMPPKDSGRRDRAFQALDEVCGFAPEDNPFPTKKKS